MICSIIIPTYNEQNDIAGTLDALLSLSYEDKEIIVVDDSTDRTPAIVRSYERNGVRLIRPAIREGRCNARNIGILAATGEVLIILNADVRLPTDFIERILPHYYSGFDYVLVKSIVANTHSLFPRYINAVANHEERGDVSWMEWTEGFSCRRTSAISAGLFPVGFAVPICAGEDGFFGEGLRKSGARKKVDFTITVNHIAPAHLKEYWSIRCGRGSGSAQTRRFLHSWTMPSLVFWALLRLAKNFLVYITLLPLTLRILTLTRYSDRGLRDFFPFMYSHFVEQIAFHYGEFTSIFEIASSERRLGSTK